MNTLILHPTDTCQWHALVNEAEAATDLILNENTESYLVFLLMRFSHGPQLIESIIALDFLEASQALPHQKVDLLRDIGDKSLLFCGLFPGIAERRHVSIDYFTEMGQAAYFSAGELHISQMADVFFQLSSDFMSLQQILQAMRWECLRSTFRSHF